MQPIDWLGWIVLATWRVDRVDTRLEWEDVSMRRNRRVRVFLILWNIFEFATATAGRGLSNDRTRLALPVSTRTGVPRLACPV